MTDNLLAPLVFSYPDAQTFILKRVCVYCEGELLIKDAPDGMYYVACPTHDLIYSHTHISRSMARKVTANTRSGMAELRKPSGLTPDEIIKKLGF